jgi:hypothetical protein
VSPGFIERAEDRKRKHLVTAFREIVESDRKIGLL